MYPYINIIYDIVNITISKIDNVKNINAKKRGFYSWVVNVHELEILNRINIQN